MTIDAHPLLTTALLVLGMMTTLWLTSLWRQDASLVDPFWGSSFVLITCWLLFHRPLDTISPRSWLLAGLTAIWGLRLSLHLLIRNRKHGEDRRYRAMRDTHGKHFWWVSFATVFLLQGIILWTVSLPIQVALKTSTSMPLGWRDLLGGCLWFVGWSFEAIGDYQLARFQRNPHHALAVLDTGLWRYTRHPNYFGDFCVWWGLYLIASSDGAAWTLFSPLLMSFLLLKVSGVSLLEKTITERRPAYLAYQTRTSAFFPWFPRKVPRQR